jgi:hypothetical protein
MTIHLILKRKNQLSLKKQQQLMWLWDPLKILSFKRTRIHLSS